MIIPDEVENLESALYIIEDLIGILQDLHYRLESMEDLSGYRVVESLLKMIDKTLERYESLD